jgi:hypothetical protein
MSPFSRVVTPSQRGLCALSRGAGGRGVVDDDGIKNAGRGMKIRGERGRRDYLSLDYEGESTEGEGRSAFRRLRRTVVFPRKVTAFAYR